MRSLKTKINQIKAVSDLIKTLLTFIIELEQNKFAIQNKEQKNIKLNKFLIRNYDDQQKNTINLIYKRNIQLSIV